MASAIHSLLRASLLLLAVLAGCKFPVIAPLYGPPAPEDPPDPQLALTDLSYEPVSPVELGEVITFRATANKTFSEHELFVRIAEDYDSFSWYLKHLLTAKLLDDGIPPDETAGDGVFSGSLMIPPRLGAREGLPVIARVEWWSTAPPPEISGAPLTVLPREE